MLDRLTVGDMERWGNLVKTWATGVNKLGDGKQYSVPKSLQDFQEQCDRALAGVRVPGYVTEIQFVQAPAKETLLLRLPPKELVEDSETALNGGMNYLIPNFYDRIYGKPAPTINSPADKLKVHAERVGDYTMNACM